MENVTLMDEYGYIKDGKVFLKGYLTYPDRQIGEVKRTEQEAIDYFKNRFIIVSKKVEELLQEIEDAQNKGSYLTKLLQLRKKLLSFDGLGNFIPLLEKLDRGESYLGSLIAVNQDKNLEIKRALLEDMKAVKVIGTDWKSTTDQLQEIKAKWIRTGPVDKEYQDEVENAFQQHMDDYFQGRRTFFSDQNRVIADRLEQFNDLIRKSDLLQRMYNVDEAAIQARQLRQEWKEVGEVPIKRSMKLYKQFKRSQQRIQDKYNRVKGIAVEKPKLHPMVEQQHKMYAEVKELVKSNDIVMASERTKALLNQWKEIRVPSQFADRVLAEKFRLACDKIFELSYLERVISRKYPAFEIRTPEDQIGIKIREMEWLIKREKGDLEMSIANAQNLSMSEDEAKQVMGRINIQRRKIQMKETILAEFKTY